MTERPCPYDDPNCTGDHTGALKSKTCPSAYARKRARGREYNREYLIDPEKLEHSRGYSREYSKRPEVYAQTRKRIRENRDRINNIKTESGCIDCGYNAHPIALDFDHRPGAEKLGNISTMAAHCSWESILTEIAKCNVRCANCHRIITAERRKESRDEGNS